MSTNNLTEESGFAIGDRTIDCQVLAVPFCGLTELCLRSPRSCGAVDSGQKSPRSDAPGLV